MLLPLCISDYRALSLSLSLFPPPCISPSRPSPKIKGLAEPYMASSSVIKMDGDEEKPTDEWRTSTTHFLTRGQTSMVSLNRVGGGGGGVAFTRCQPTLFSSSLITIVHRCVGGGMLHLKH